MTNSNNMGRQNTTRRTASLWCLFLALSLCVSDAADSFPQKRLRGETSSKTSGKRRILSNKKKSKTDKTDKTRVLGPERMIVRCKPEMDSDNCLEELSITGEEVNVIHYLPSIHAYAIEVDLSTMEDLKRMGVDLMEDHERQPLVLEGSIQYHRTLDGQSIPYGIDLIKAPQVWDRYAVRGQGVRICVLDTGIEATHPDFAEMDLTGYTGSDAVTPWNDDQRGHGTHISGIIAASDNDIGVVGVAPEAEVYMVRVFQNNGRLFGSDVVAALQACKDAGANLINLSFGGFDFDEAEHAMFEQLYDEGILAVAASGNIGGPEVYYPASYDKVLSVAASDVNNRVTTFSSVNSRTDIAAPGVGILSTYRNGGYVSLSGTSMAAPHVTGTLALLLSYRPTLSPQDLRRSIIISGRSGVPAQNQLPLNIVDAMAAIQLVENGLPPAPSNSNCIEADLWLQTDQYGSETAYRLRRVSDQLLVWIGASLRSRREYTESACLLRTECYQFEIRDSYGDGILDPGGVVLTYDGAVRFSGGNFGSGGGLMLGNC